ncbi:MAG: L-threonylcarbamoyladenylate synthase [Patescibacteria group bacterium]|nr:L-threonylcarbamoyladenylate synthase [Patescibacteria group bacterium]
MNNQIDGAVRILNEGGIVIFPTDTAFGIGCRMDNKESVKRLFSIRKRPENQATPVLFNNLEMMKEYLLDISKEVKEKLMDKYWPGALTIIFPCKTDKVFNLIRGNSNNMGVRIPDNDKLISIIEKLGVGILGPSANFHGKPTPYYFEDLDPKLVRLVDYVVEGECRLKDVSTVIDVSVKPWQIRREGAVKLNL